MKILRSKICASSMAFHFYSVLLYFCIRHKISDFIDQQQKSQLNRKVIKIKSSL